MRVYRRWIISIITVLALAGSRAESSVILDGEEIVFSLTMSSGASVYLVGDFNGWNPTVDKMVWNDGRYEIRLILLPGKYGYLFVVNGESRQDIDHPCRDSKGNSCFYFSEDNGRYNLSLSGAHAVKRKTKSVENDLSAAVMAVYDKYDYVNIIKGDFEGDIAGNTRLRMSSGVMRDRGNGNAGPMLLGAEALSSFGKWKLRAFYRDEELGFNDPLELIGRVGPFDYPLGLFCNGIGIDVAVTKKISGKVFYAGRLEGYRSGLEAGVYDSLNTNSLQFKNRDLRDSDIIGAAIGGGVGRINLRYLFRHDKRYAEWGFAGNGIEYFSSGSEEVNIHGVLFSYEPCDSTSIEIEYLNGTTTLNKGEKLSSCDEDCRLADGSGESGWKIYAGIKRTLGAGNMNLYYYCQGLNTFSKEGQNAQGGARRVLGFDAAVDYSGFKWIFEGTAENYSKLSPDHFWFQRNNFWLDGDRIDSNSLLFLQSMGFYKACLGAKKVYSENGNSHYPYDLDISLLLMCERVNFSNRLIEMKISHAIPVGPIIPFGLTEKYSFLDGVEILADFRGIVYKNKDWKGKNRFFDPFLAFRKKFDDYSWCMAGIGLNPYAFDKWHYNITYDGRKMFLEDMGIFSESAFLREDGFLELLSNAEEEMADSWIISFEANIGF